MIRRLLLAFVLVLAGAGLVPAAAGAHASLTGSTPESGAVLDVAPEQVVFSFSERVEGSFGALRVVDDRGRRVDDGRVGRVGGRDDRLAVGLRPGTGRGAYAATYRVVSADGHPVTGGATFVVGRGVTAVPLDVRELTAQSGAPAGIGTALSVARLVRYLGIGGATGLLVLVLVVWAPLRRRGSLFGGDDADDDAADDAADAADAAAAGADDDAAAAPTGGRADDETTAGADAADLAFSRAAGRALRGLALVGLAGSLAALVLQAAVAGGTGLGDAVRPGTLVDVARTRTGAWFLVSAVAFLLLALVAGRAVRTPRGLRGREGRPAVLAGLLVVVLVAAPALGGHAAAASPSWALVPIQIVHVAGMGAWLGGLLGLLLVLPHATRTRPAGRQRHALLAAVLLRFSPVALVSVGVLTAAGTGLALLHLTSLYDLTDTAYGRAIFVKVALLVGAIWVAVVQREYLLPRLRRLAAGEEPAPVGDGAAADGPASPPAAAGLGPGTVDVPGASVGAGSAPDPDPGPDPDDEDDEPRRPPSAATGRHVRLALRAEVALLVFVLAATGALAGYAPPKSLDQGPVTVTRQAGGAELQLTVDPARVGSNVMHLYAFGRDGQPVRRSRELTVRAVPPGRSGGSDVPVDVPFVDSGPGHWTAAAVPLGTRGEWTLEVVLRTSAFDQVEADLPVRVR